ncbi:hypothetical protein ACHWQZ_G014433 [Mnemiopsis leidyi]
MISREQVALVYNYAQEQALLQEQLKDLGNEALLRRLDVPDRTAAQSSMRSWLTRRRREHPLTPVDSNPILSSEGQDVQTHPAAVLQPDPRVLQPAPGTTSVPDSDYQAEDMPSLGRHNGTESIVENRANINEEISLRTRVVVSELEPDHDPIVMENSYLDIADLNSLPSYTSRYSSSAN